MIISVKKRYNEPGPGNCRFMLNITYGKTVILNIYLIGVQCSDNISIFPLFLITVILQRWLSLNGVFK